MTSAQADSRDRAPADAYAADAAAEWERQATTTYTRPAAPRPVAAEDQED